MEKQDSDGSDLILREPPIMYPRSWLLHLDAGIFLPTDTDLHTPNYFLLNKLPVSSIQAW